MTFKQEQQKSLYLKSNGYYLMACSFCISDNSIYCRVLLIVVNEHVMDDITFEFLIEQYFYYKLLRPTTMRSYRKVLRTFEEFTSLNPAQVDQLTVLQWRHIVLGEHKRSSRTWNNKVSHMRALFNFGMEQELLPHKKILLMVQWFVLELKRKRF